jgi:hypothetical protein
VEKTLHLITNKNMVTQGMKAQENTRIDENGKTGGKGTKQVKREQSGEEKLKFTREKFLKQKILRT